MDPTSPWSNYSPHYSCLRGAGNPTPQQGQLGIPPSLPRQDQMAGYAAAAPHPWLLPAHHGLSHQSQPSESPITSAPVIHTSYDSNFLSSTFQPSSKGHFPGLAPHGGSFFKPLGKDNEISDLRSGFGHCIVGSSPLSPDPSPNLSPSSGNLYSTWRHAGMLPTSGATGPFGVLPHETVVPSGKGMERGPENMSIPSKEPKSTMDHSVNHKYRNVPSSGHPSSYLDASVSRAALIPQNEPYFSSVAQNTSVSTVRATNFCAYTSTPSQTSVPRNAALHQNYFSSFTSVEKHDAKQNGAPQYDQYHSPGTFHGGTHSSSNPGQGHTTPSPRFEQLPVSAETMPCTRANTTYAYDTAYDLSQPLRTSSQASPYAAAVASHSPAQAKAERGEYDSFAGSSSSHVSHHSPYPPMSTPAPASTPAYPTPPSIDQAQVPHPQEESNVVYSSVITRAHAPVSNSPVYSGASSFSSKSVLVIKKDTPPDMPSVDVPSMPATSVQNILCNEQDRNHVTMADSAHSGAVAGSNQSVVKYSRVPPVGPPKDSPLMPGGPCTPLDPAMVRNSPNMCSSPMNRTVPSVNVNMGDTGENRSLPPQSPLMGTNEVQQPNVQGQPPYERVILKISRKRGRGKRGRPRKEHVVESCVAVDYRADYTSTEPMKPMNVMTGEMSSRSAPPPPVPATVAPVVGPPCGRSVGMFGSYPPVASSSSHPTPPSIHIPPPPVVPVHTNTSCKSKEIPSCMPSPVSGQTSAGQRLHQDCPTLQPNVPQPYSGSFSSVPGSTVQGPTSTVVVQPENNKSGVGFKGLPPSSSSSQQGTQERKRTMPRIEDDFSFLAKLPTGYRSEGPNTIAKNSRAPKNEGFLKCFLSFLEYSNDPKTEDPSSGGDSATSKRCGRGGRKKLQHIPELEATKTAATNPETSATSANPKSPVDSPAVQAPVEGSGLGSSSGLEKATDVPNPKAPASSSGEEETEEVENVNAQGVFSQSVSVAVQRLPDGTRSSDSEDSSAESVDGKSNNEGHLTNSGTDLSTGNEEVASPSRRGTAGRKRGRGRKRAGVEARAAVKRAKRGELEPDEENGNNESANESSDDGKAVESPPRRTSMRKCKAQVIKKQEEKRERRSLRHRSSTDNEDNDAEEPKIKVEVEEEEEEEEERLADFDSDCDPAWTPRDKESDKLGPPEEGRSRPAKRGRRRGTPAGRRTSGARLANQAEGDDPDDPPKEQGKPGKKPAASGSAKESSNQSGSDEEDKKPPNEKGASSSSTSNAAAALNDAKFIREGFFKTGDFVVVTEESKCDEPPSLWRIEGKSLIQRFEPIEKDGEKVYRNTSSYSSWNPSIRFKYSPVTIRYLTCNRNNMVIKFLGITTSAPKPSTPTQVASPSSCSEDVTYSPTSTKQETNGAGDDAPEHSLLREHFEIFLQTLVSQALDPNFISEIMKEKDEYFLSHLNAMETLASEKKSLLLKKGDWDALRAPFERYPGLNLSPDLESEGESECQMCHKKSSQIIHLSGCAYDETSLTPCEVQIKTEPLELQFNLCNECSEAASLYSQLQHQKYNFYCKCRDKVDSIRAEDESKASHVILEQCLQDTDWVNQMFQEIETVWKACEKIR